MAREAKTWCDLHNQERKRKPSGARTCKACNAAATARSNAKRKERDPEGVRRQTREKVARHRATKPKLAPSRKEERESRLQEIGLRPPTCRDCRKVKVSALGRSCRPCALLRARKDGVSTTSNKIKDSTPSHVKGRENAERDVKAAKPFSAQRVPRSAAVAVIGRDIRALRVLCEELGIVTGDDDCYLGADLLRVRDVLRERAVEWKNGTRPRPF